MASVQFRRGDTVQPAAPLSKSVIFGERAHGSGRTRAAEKAEAEITSVGTSGLGGVLGWICVHPFNTLAVRMNLSVMSSGGAPPAPFASFASDLIKREGVAGLYAGLGAGCLRQVFYATSRYGLFETFRDALAKYRKTDFAQRFATASVAGGCAALISCPVEGRI
ncbi:hypothetical protein EMIHUDRAFT_215087 [Emiliania huxleyi CCMP1516]|uniref:Uncharacterized protein n=2 Tax=Emiliania huxleyi TaxID=2903 RepID=A0A0D3IHW3_EMIH1|nr:hypothetical protein EMIHUDRAFT_215087 [Emiliania huxleyi CCMP1516]EOD10848.1 hypothetical protein EMIHUDRAFT_215087 [Emiliania huxleyi CCMP1516]|eukprot:XP_005763277.1 hypothetical protein EMIHUDRAFT_215087 [Emiliania huxleyi CCMP1516]